MNTVGVVDCKTVQFGDVAGGDLDRLVLRTSAPRRR